MTNGQALASIPMSNGHPLFSYFLELDGYRPLDATEIEDVPVDEIVIDGPDRDGDLMPDIGTLWINGEMSGHIIDGQYDWFGTNPFNTNDIDSTTDVVESVDIEGRQIRVVVDGDRDPTIFPEGQYRPTVTITQAPSRDRPDYEQSRCD